MSDDLVKRLRDSCYLAFDDGTNDYASAEQAADRIEKLEAALREILLELSDKDIPSWLGHGVMAMIATNALAGRKKND